MTGLRETWKAKNVDFRNIFYTKKRILPIKAPHTRQKAMRCAYVVQNGTSNVTIPAIVKPILLTSNGDIYGSFVINPDANRLAVLLKPKKKELEFFNN